MGRRQDAIEKRVQPEGRKWYRGWIWKKGLGDPADERGKNMQPGQPILHPRRTFLPHLLLHMGLELQVVLLDLGMEGGPGDP